MYHQSVSQSADWQHTIRYREPLIVCLVCLLPVLYSDQLVSLTDRYFAPGPQGSVQDQPADGINAIRDIRVRIEPPPYTGLAVVETSQLDLELPEGSRVEWELVMADSGDEYSLQFSDEKHVELTRNESGQMKASAVIEKSDLYRVVSTGNGQNQSNGEIYSLTVSLDRAPDIRMIEPLVSALEIPKSGSPRFTSKALVRDDFGVQDVEILASVARGSGEGVKFRDQKLLFDHSSETTQGFVYQKDWDLQALDMEPGDEVYFTVIAMDNRSPVANTGRSETVIVRWLDDEQDGLAADGLAIDFIPEFFKSQRQIIIDTEQLIEDQPHLPVQEFKDTSYEIGQAQADLKQKYGQYLGDEFGEGPGEQFTGSGESGPAHDGHEEGHDADADPAGGNDNRNLNSTADIIRLFGHDHGDPEIGPITKRNPVALMKRAIGEMWKAERHLMQAEPGLALPFEYEAYRYLKLARQADRIYVKRLGFEPPPVSEERRLSGELDEILSYRTNLPEPVIDPQGKLWEQILLKNTYQMLKTQPSFSDLSKEERELLSRLSLEFTRWSQQRPALIRHAASLEKLAMAGRLSPEACNNCLVDLEATIWDLIEQSAEPLTGRRTAWQADDSLIQDYQQFLNQTSETGAPVTDLGGNPK